MVRVAAIPVCRLYRSGTFGSGDDEVQEFIPDLLKLSDEREHYIGSFSRLFDKCSVNMCHLRVTCRLGSKHCNGEFSLLQPGYPERPDPVKLAQYSGKFQSSGPLMSRGWMPDSVNR